MRHGKPEDFDKDGQRLFDMSASLHDDGRVEARHAGEVINRLYNPKHLVSSTSPRAWQTAEEINTVIGKNFEIREIGIGEEMVASVTPKPLGLPTEVVERCEVSTAEAYAEALRMMQELKAIGTDGDVVHVTHRGRMVMMKWALLHDKEPTEEEFLAFANHHRDNLFKLQQQTADTKFCTMFAVDLSAEKGKQIEYSYQKDRELGKGAGNSD